MRIKTFALAACISTFAFAACNNGNDKKETKDSTTTQPIDTSKKMNPSDTGKIDTSKVMPQKPITNP